MCPYSTLAPQVFAYDMCQQPALSIFDYRYTSDYRCYINRSGIELEIIAGRSTISRLNYAGVGGMYTVAKLYKCRTLQQDLNLVAEL